MEYNELMASKLQSFLRPTYNYIHRVDRDMVTCYPNIGINSTSGRIFPPLLPNFIHQSQITPCSNIKVCNSCIQTCHHAVVTCGASNFCFSSGTILPPRLTLSTRKETSDQVTLFFSLFSCVVSNPHIQFCRV
jgi:hypothetical protein